MKAAIKSFVFLMALSTMPSALASSLTWANWTSENYLGNPSSTVTGNIGSVTVTATGDFVPGVTQLTGQTSYTYPDIWSPETTYHTVYGNGPPNPDIVALSNAGTETITFSQSVTNPLIALMSWNGSEVTFNSTIKILTTGGPNNYWGVAGADLNKLVINATSTGFTGPNGEGNGVIQVLGTFNQSHPLTFTNANTEYWHGFTVGTVPLPAALFFVAPALAGVFGFLRRKA